MRFTRMLAVSALALAACGDDVTNSASSTTTTTDCGATTGTLEGHVYRYALPGDPASSPAGAGIVYLRRAASDTPLQAMADGSGAYQVELDAGSWLVGGEHQNCSSSSDVTAPVAACATTTLDVVLDACTK